MDNTNKELETLKAEKLALEVSIEKAKVEAMKVVKAKLDAVKLAEEKAVEAKKVAEAKATEEAKIAEAVVAEKAKVAEAAKVEAAKKTQTTKGIVNGEKNTSQNWDNFILSSDNDLKNEGLTITSYKGMGLNRLGGY